MFLDKKESALCNPDDDVYDFQLLEFITRGPKTNRSTDLVPSFWVEFNKKNGRLFTKFLPSSYTADASAVLEHYVKEKRQPMDSWNSYNIKLIGQASMFLFFLTFALQNILKYYYSNFF